MRREDLLAFFIRLSDAFWNHRASDGALLCPKHHLNHTGKTSSAITLNLFLYRQTNDSRYLSRADTAAQYTRSQLRSETIEGKETCYFYPSRSKGNMSNMRIDSGMIIDALVTFVREYPDLSEDAKADYTDVIRRVCDTHLAHAAAEGNAPPNQQVWAGTGVAAAAGLLRDSALREASIACIENTLKRMRLDGFFSYHPAPEKYGLQSNANGITPYYQSRHFAFIFFMLEQLGSSVEPYRKELENGLVATLATILPDGSKLLALECKRWYWHSDREAGSYPHDIYLLLKGWRITGDQTYARAAAALMRLLIKQQDRDGSIHAAVGSGEEFQCRTISNADAVWITRVWDDLLEALEMPETPPIIAQQHFEPTGLMRITTPEFVLVLRENAEPCTTAWGAGVSGALPVGYAKKVASQWVSTVPRHGTEWNGTAPYGWFFFPARVKWFHFDASFWRANARDLWQELYYLSVEIRARNLRAAMHLLVSHILVTPFHLFFRPFAMQWGESTRKESPNTNELRYEVVPKNREKTMQLKTKVERTYFLSEDGFSIKDRIIVHEFILWAGLCIPRNVRIQTEATMFRFGNTSFFFFLPKGRTVQIMVESSL